MKKIITGLFLFIVSAAFVSCQKDVTSGPSSNQLLGNWKFISMKAYSSTDQTVNDGSETSETIAISNYTTINNSGSISFDASKMATSNISYSIDTVYKGYIYENGELIDSTVLPFQVDVPSSSGTTSYRMVGSDSLYFDGGTMFINGVAQQAVPSGAKIKFEGDKLYLTQVVSQSTTQSVFGETLTTDMDASVIVTLQRQ